MSLRIVKQPSEESPNFSRVKNRINFQIDSQVDNEVLDLSQSYLYLDVNPPTATQGVHAWAWGAPNYLGDGQHFYDTSSLLRNVRLSTNQQELEYVRDVNFLNENKNLVQLNPEVRKSLSTAGRQKVDSLTGGSTGQFDANLLRSGTTVSTVGSCKATIPLSDLFSLGSRTEFPISQLEPLHLFVELEDQQQILTEVLSWRGNTDTADDPGVVGAGDEDEVTLTTSVNSLDDVPFEVDDTLYFMANNRTVGSFVIETGDVASVIINGTGNPVITTSTDIWITGNNYTEASVFGDVEPVTAAGASTVLQTVKADYKKGNVDCPYWVGQEIGVVYVNSTTGAKSQTTRLITEIGVLGAIGTLTITTDGANYPVITASGNAFIYTVADANANNWEVAEASLVLHRKRLEGKELEKHKKSLQAQRNYLTDNCEVVNQEETSWYSKKFDLDPNTQSVMILHKNSNNLLSREPDVNSYRETLNNVPLSNRNITAWSSIYQDRLARYYGRTLRNNDLRNQNDAIQYPVLVISDKASGNVLQMDIKADEGKTLKASNLHVYKKVLKQIDM